MIVFMLTAQLMKLAPETATVVELDPVTGAVVSSKEVPSALIHKGDVLKVRKEVCWVALIPYLAQLKHSA